LGLKKKQGVRLSCYVAPNPEILYAGLNKKIEIALIKNGNLTNKTNSTKLNGEL